MSLLVKRHVVGELEAAMLTMVNCGRGAWGFGARHDFLWDSINGMEERWQRRTSGTVAVASTASGLIMFFHDN
jgi:hypothetical protein